MRSRRHTSKIILAVASVFLFFLVSCGIPTYIVPKISFSNVKSGDNAESFTVAYSCSDSLGDSGRVGLLLLYHIEQTTPTSRSAITSKFKSQFVPSEYNGANVDVTEGEPVLNANDINVYAFRKNGSVITDPDYTTLLSNSDDFSRDVALAYQDGAISLSIGGMPISTLSLDPATEVGDSQYIGIYAAVSVKSNSYTNHYWSDLKFVGYIRVVEE
ncbi:MAG: hypothetical protein IJT86_01260 [Spirochaetales bacterium]|nr:hypothetical protein [Spirochaetales bacterium]MBQ7728959.1 hypothetical protein [Spirochaetales bacterium]